MTSGRFGAGRVYAWLAALGVVSLVASAWSVLGGGDRPVSRGPAAVVVPTVRTPETRVVAGVRHIVTREAPARIIPDTVPPHGETAAADLLWLVGKQTARSPGGGVLAIDPGGSVVEFDAFLRPHRPRLALGGRSVASVAAATDGGLWITDAAGFLLRTDKSGDVLFERTTPFAFPALVSTTAGSGPWIVRSPDRFAYAWDSGGALAAQIGNDGAVTRRVGVARLPAHVMLQDLANAGRLVALGDKLFFAPFIRDELVALDARGDTAWVASRGLPQSTREPKFEITGGKVVVDYHPVNLGVAVGPDGLLYLLSTPGFTTQRSRLDAFDPASGALVRSTELATALPTIAVDRSGRVYLLDESRLLTGAAPAERQPFPHIALATSAGDSVASEGLRGRVVLVNLWASWCKPCREEMPALDTLRRLLASDGLVFVSINGDATPADAHRFLRDAGIEMPFALGGPGITQAFHTLGLPHTVLLDRDGQVVQSWPGYGGPEQTAAIRAAARLELSRSPIATQHVHAHH